MLEIVMSNQFRRDLKLAAKRGYDLELLDSVVTSLANEETLPERFGDHNLIGEYAGFRECHLQPDWLLVYRVDRGQLILFLSRTGSLANLF